MNTRNEMYLGRERHKPTRSFVRSAPLARWAPRRRPPRRAELLRPRPGRQRPARSVVVASLAVSLRAPRALRCFALSLLALPLSRVLLSLPSRLEPLEGLTHRCLDPRHLLEHVRGLHAQCRGLGRFREVRVSAVEVLPHARHGSLELLPLRTLRSPLTRDDIEILALFSGQVGQRLSVTGGLLGSVGQVLRFSASLQGDPDRRDLVPRDLVRAFLLIGDSALPRLDLSDPCLMCSERVVVVLTDLLPLAGQCV